MFDCSKSKSCYGITLIVIGSILLLNVLGILKETTNLVLSVAGLALVAYGFILLDGPQHIQKLFKKNSSAK